MAADASGARTCIVHREADVWGRLAAVCRLISGRRLTATSGGADLTFRAASADRRAGSAPRWPTDLRSACQVGLHTADVAQRLHDSPRDIVQMELAWIGGFNKHGTTGRGVRNLRDLRASRNSTQIIVPHHMPYTFSAASRECTRTGMSVLRRSLVALCNPKRFGA